MKDPNTPGGRPPMPDEDAPLRDRFAAMRATDAPHTPAFERVVQGRRAAQQSRASASTPWLRPAMALGALALLAVAVGTWRGRAVPTTTLATARDSVVIPPTLAFVPGSLRVPTDYFLDLANATRVDEVPSIGDVDWYPLLPASDSAPTSPHDSMTNPVTNSRRRN